MFKYIGISLILLGLGSHPLQAQTTSQPLENPQIDSETFLKHIAQSQAIRLKRRVTEAEFIEMSQDPNTIILDARSAARFEQMHIQGAKSLSFTEFTAENLAAVIPTKTTRVLIYCNNNIAESPIAFATKAAPASLNLSTYTSLYTYGYTNVYELGPVINPKTSTLQFEGLIHPATP